LTPTLWQGEEIEQILDLRPLGDDRFANVYAQANTNRAMFGGQMLGLALMAAARTVEDGRAPHAMHADFLAQAGTESAVDVAVSRVRDGRSFSTRHVEVAQAGDLRFDARISFQAPDRGFFHQVPIASDAGVPDDHPPAEAGLERYADKLTRHPVVRFTRMRSVEIRPVDFHAYAFGGEKVSSRRLWTRIPGAARIAAPVAHHALLAYLSDYWLAGTVALAHAEAMQRRRIFMATLNHSIWFSASVRVDGWLLLDTDTPSASGGRGLVRGTFHDRDGTLVATVVQEVLLRHL